MVAGMLPGADGERKPTDWRPRLCHGLRADQGALCGSVEAWPNAVCVGWGRGRRERAGAARGERVRQARLMLTGAVRDSRRAMW